MVPTGQLIESLTVSLEVVEHRLDDLLLLIAVEVWSLEVAVEVALNCYCLDCCLEGHLVVGLLLPSYWNLLLLFLDVHCQKDLTGHLLLTLFPPPPPEPSGGPPPPALLGSKRCPLQLDTSLDSQETCYAAWNPMEVEVAVP